MNFSKTKITVGLLVLGTCLISAGTSLGATVTYNLRAGTTPKTMPDGKPVLMWGFADDTTAGAGLGTVQVPGPQLNVAAGDTLTIHLENTLPEPVSILIPGQYGSTVAGQKVVNTDPASAGRVRSLTLEAAPGSSQDFTWNNVQAGTFLYHSGSHPAVQVQMGLYGALTVLADATHAYTDVPFDSSVTLLFSEIDPDVHEAVAGNSFGPGPSFQPGELTATASAIANGLVHAHTTDAVYDHLWSLLSPDTQANLTSATGPAIEEAVSAAIAELLGGSSIYDPLSMPDVHLSDATFYMLWLAPEVNQPTEPVPYNPGMVRLNRLLLTDALANPELGTTTAVTLPPVKSMTSTIRSYPQYFLVNGEAQNGSPVGSGGNNVFTAGTLGKRVLLRMLNAGMDAHVPAILNGGDLQLVAEDGQKAPYVRNTYSVWLPALKTVDAIFVPPLLPGVDPCSPALEYFPISDRRLGVVNGITPGGGMLAYLEVTPTTPTAVTAITVAPLSSIVPDGAIVTLTASITGGAYGLPYVWKKNGNPIPGATSATYTFAAVYSTGAADSYVASVTDCDHNTVTATTPATVTVTPPAPTVVVDPATRSVPDGTSASFTANVVNHVGPGTLTYAWRKSPSPTVLATTPILSFLADTADPSKNAGTYTVTVTDSATVPTGSASGQLIVTPVAASIVTAPAAQTTCYGSPATFSVTVSGTGPFTYTWQSSLSTLFLLPTTEATHTGVASRTDSFTVPNPILNRYYRVIVQGITGPAQTSANSGAQLTVSTPTTPSITPAGQPVNQTLQYGVGGTVTFTVAASSTCNGGTIQDPLTYQWQKAPLVGGSFADIAGATGSTYSFSVPNPVLADAARYRVSVRNSRYPGFGSPATSITSSTATLTVRPPAPAIDTPPGPASQTVAAGSTVTYTVAASDAAAGATLSYQWRKNGANLNNGGAVSGATTSTLTLTGVTVGNAGQYDVVVYALGGGVTTTGAANSTATPVPPAKLSVTQTFNGGGGSLTIPSSGIPSGSGNYPRSASVPSFTGSTVKNASVTLTLSHNRPYDVKALLVNPSASAKVEFMSGIGAVPTTTLFYPVSSVGLTFDDTVGPSVTVPTTGAATSGIYYPTVTKTVTVFPSGAPSLPYTTTLSSFNGFTQTSSGGWSLYVVDDTTGPTSSTAQSISSWSLTLTVGP